MPLPKPCPTLSLLRVRDCSFGLAASQEIQPSPHESPLLSALQESVERARFGRPISPLEHVDTSPKSITEEGIEEVLSADTSPVDPSPVEPAPLPQKDGAARAAPDEPELMPAAAPIAHPGLGGLDKEGIVHGSCTCTLL